VRAAEALKHRVATVNHASGFSASYRVPLPALVSSRAPSGRVAGQ